MRVVHFTQGATDPLQYLQTSGTRIVSLASGHGAGMGVLPEESEQEYSLETSSGAIVIVVEAPCLVPHGNRRSCRASTCACPGGGEPDQHELESAPRCWLDGALTGQNDPALFALKAR